MIKKQLYISPEAEMIEIRKEGNIMTASVEGINMRSGSWEVDNEDEWK